MQTIKLNARQLGHQVAGSAVSIILITLILAAAIVGVAQQPAAPAVPTPALRLPVIVVQKEREIQVRYVVVTATPEPAEANTDPGRNTDTYQQLPTATAWVADPVIVQQGESSVSTFDPPADAPRYCKTFGGDAADWRNFDAHYSASPACEH